MMRVQYRKASGPDELEYILHVGDGDVCQAKGERQFLIDAVIRADGNSSSAARVLLEKYPDDAEVEALFHEFDHGTERAPPRVG